MPRFFHTTWILAAGSLALLAAPAPGEVLIDEFSHVGIYTNPWPYIQTFHEHRDIFETVEKGVILGQQGRIRETFIGNTMFANPGVDIARMGVNTQGEAFEYTATAGVANWIDFGYGCVIENKLHADFSTEKGLLIDFSELTLAPGAEAQYGGGLGAGEPPYGHILSPLFTLTAGGPQSVFIAFQDFADIADINLANVGGVAVSFHAPGGTEFTIERIVAARPAPGDANADGTVDVLDILAVLTAWGPCYVCLADFNDDGLVNVEDLLIVLANWT